MGKNIDSTNRSPLRGSIKSGNGPALQTGHRYAAPLNRRMGQRYKQVTATQLNQLRNIGKTSMNVGIHDHEKSIVDATCL